MRSRSILSLADIGELGFLARALPRARARDVIVGPGDDCAVVQSGRGLLLFTVDSVVEGSHFQVDWLSPLDLGRRAFAVNASDIAAMGGWPLWALVNLSCRPDYPARSLLAIQRGIVAAAAAAQSTVVGGNLTAGDRLAVTITLVGGVDHVLKRSGAQPGDVIFVTGTLGDSALGVRCLRRGEPSRFCVERFRAPSARLVAGRALAKAKLATAAIDISDGLVQDLGHICSVSRVAAEIETAKLPLSREYRRKCSDDPSLALTGGEDYELLFTVAAAEVPRLARYASRLGCTITEIGRITAGRGIRIDGRRARREPGGYEHFVSP